MTEERNELENTDEIETVQPVHHHHHHHHHHRHHHRRSKFTVATWFILAALCAAFYLIASNFIIFPNKFKLPLLIALAALAVVMAIFSFHKFLKRGRIITAVINIILSAALAAGCVYLPHLENQLKGVFTEEGQTTEVTINTRGYTY
jgi:TRAP-type uncharacterized transport system fused permease subunit